MTTFLFIFSKNTYIIIKLLTEFFRKLGKNESNIHPNIVILVIFVFN